VSLSPRLAAIVEALPLRPDSRVLEIGCGPGAAARAVAARLTTGHILAIDRSATPSSLAPRMSFRQVAAEDFVLLPGEQPFTLVFAVRVGALDGRHPELGRRILARLAEVTTPDARLFTDGGTPLHELTSQLAR